MLIWVGLALVALALVWVAAKGFVSANPKLLADWARRIGGFLLAGIGLLFFATGRELPAMIFFAGSAALFGLPVRGAGGPLGGLLGGLFGGLFGRGQAPPDFTEAGTGAPGRSAIATDWLDMALDHGTGALSGHVKQGQFAGRDLAAMTPDDLMALHVELAGDGQSRQLLETYLERRLGPDWRGAAPGPSTPAAPPGAMTEAEARAILGVGPDDGPEAIRAAHHRLMKKLHPDLGGSTYLAGRINAARDFLLGG